MNLRVDKRYRRGFLFVFVALASAGGTSEVRVDLTRKSFYLDSNEEMRLL